MKKILVTGATGQIGSELVPALRARYGNDNVIAAGHSRNPSAELLTSGPYCRIDVRDKEAMLKTVSEHSINTIYHLASLLSARAEENPGQHSETVDQKVPFLVAQSCRPCSKAPRLYRID